MSRQEILSWTSLGVSVSVLVYYLLIVFGWPESIPDFSALFTKVFFNVFWVAVIVEFIVDIAESVEKKKVSADERDLTIEARGHKNAYTFVVVAIVFLLSQMVLSRILGDDQSMFSFLGSETMVFHMLVITLLISSATKRATMLWYYIKGV